MNYTPSIALDNGLTVIREASGSIWFTYTKVNQVIRVPHPKDIGCRETRKQAIRFMQAVTYSVNAKGSICIAAHEFNRIASAISVDRVG